MRQAQRRQQRVVARAHGERDERVAGARRPKMLELLLEVLTLGLSDGGDGAQREAEVGDADVEALAWPDREARGATHRQAHKLQEVVVLAPRAQLTTGPFGT